MDNEIHNLEYGACGHHPCHQYDFRTVTDLPNAAHGCVTCERDAARDQLSAAMRQIAALEFQLATQQWRPSARRVTELTGCVAYALGRTWGEGEEGKHWSRRFEELNEAISELRQVLNDQEVVD